MAAFAHRPSQTRTVRATTAWPPPSAQMYTRPWRSSPLVFSTLPPIISESSEESHENERGRSESARDLRSPSSSSLGSFSASASGYGSRNASGSALVDGEASTSSVSLVASTGAHGTSSSQGHGSSQSHSKRPARLSKSWGRRTTLAWDVLPAPRNVSDVSITPPPRARTLSHGHSRPASFPVHPVALTPSMPPTYSRASPLPPSEANTTKQPPSQSRDPDSNWMSSSPFGPAEAPKFSRLAMASPRVVMPLSAKQYRKQKARESIGKDKEKEPPTSSNRVSFVDNALPASQSPNGVPLVKVSPPPLGDVHQPPGDHSPVDRRGQPQPQVDPLSPQPLPQAPTSPHPPPPKPKRPRSRPNTPPRSSPLATHPPISPKSSSGTFYSVASSSDDDTVPPARPRPRPHRRKSVPDRLSNGARLSLLEAMNRLTEGAAMHRLSSVSQTDGANRFSVASQASGHTLFYDVAESEQGGGNGNRNAVGGGPRNSISHTQSLEDLSSALARTGIEVVHPAGDVGPGVPLDDERKGKRNVRMVRISDIVEVSPPPVTRRRKLTKSRAGSTRGSASASVPGAGAGPAPGTEMAKEVKAQPQPQTQERRTSLLPWRSKGSGDNKGSAVGAGSVPPASGGESGASTPTKGLVQPSVITVPASPSQPPSPIATGSAHVESHSKLKSNGSPAKKTVFDTPLSNSTTAPIPNPESPPSTPPRQSRRSTFSFLPSPPFRRSKREKSNTAPSVIDIGLDQNTKGKPKGVESGTDSTSTSIRTITQGSQSTLTPASPGVYDLTTLASSGGLSGSGRDTGSSVPMLRRVNAQEMATAGTPSQSEWEGKGDSTPSLITNGSTATSSSVPGTPSFVRLGGDGESFTPRPSALKESFTDTSEEDSEGMHGGGRTSRMGMRRRQEQSPLARAGGGWEISEEGERYLRPSARPGSRPGTASSTVTTATEGSYMSFSTIPASTTSSPSTSRSESPPPMVGDKRDRVVSMSLCGDGDEDVHGCTLCGHPPTSPSVSLPPSPTRGPDLPGMHPMFTVPLITVPAPALGTYPRSALLPSSNTPYEGRPTNMGGGTSYSARDAGGRKSERQMSVPVPAAVAVGVRHARHDQHHVHVNTNGGPVTTATTKTRKHRRPQTAPPGTGDSASNFIEDVKAMRAREESVDVDVGGHRLTKQRESRFKAVLKGLLRWNG